VFANSSLGKALRDGSLGIPEDKPLPGTNDPLPHVIVGDEAFPLRTYLLTPYARAQVRGCEQKSVFNYRLGRARRVSENCFDLITQKFRVFQRRLQQTPEHVNKIVLATCVLHNFLRVDIISFPDEEENNQGNSALQPLPHIGGNSAVQALQVRDHFSDYFVSPAGSVEWQDKMIRRGLQLQD
jgi:hypothetical protein